LKVGIFRIPVFPVLLPVEADWVSQSWPLIGAKRKEKHDLLTYCYISHTFV
jgi:hypothetical protein